MAENQEIAVKTETMKSPDAVANKKATKAEKKSISTLFSSLYALFWPARYVFCHSWRKNRKLCAYKS